MRIKGWLDTLFAQVFSDEAVIAPAQFLRGNFNLGLFAIFVLFCGLSERMNLPFAILLAITALTHLVGPIAAGAAPDATRTIIFVQGVALWLATTGLVATSTYLTLTATSLSNVRYLPGIVFSLFTYASLEIHFCGPPALREQLRPRRAGLIAGAVGELVSLATLIWRLSS